MAPLFDGLFALAEQTLVHIREVCARHGIQLDPGLELRRGEGFFCYCDLKTGHIYMSLPDLSRPEGPFHLLVLQSLFGCPDRAEMDRLLRYLIPWFLAHEVGHHLRRVYGRFSEDRWLEEQVANRFASAICKRRWNQAEWLELRQLLGRAFASLTHGREVRAGVVQSYESVIDAMASEQELSWEALEQAVLTGHVMDIAPEDLLAEASLGVQERLDARDRHIESFNKDYTSDVVYYTTSQVGWMLFELDRRDEQYLCTFARESLGIQPSLLPVPTDTTEPTEAELRALYDAHLCCKLPGARGWFYRRYRARLLRMLALHDPAFAVPEAALHLGQWEAGDMETLSLARHRVPAALRPLLPDQIAAPPRSPAEVMVGLREETDRRIFAVCQGAEDLAATNTLERLALLERTELFGSLPATLMLESAHDLCRLRLRAGEILLHEGRWGDDVYILLSGRLSLSNPQGVEIGRGQIIGEMAFLTGQARSSTVFAADDTECLVLRSEELRLLCYRHPAVPMRIARILATRLEAG